MANSTVLNTFLMVDLITLGDNIYCMARDTELILEQILVDPAAVVAKYDVGSG
jgi:hypothetical protein